MTDQEPPGPPPPPPAGELPVSDIALPTLSAPARPKPPRKWLGRGGGWIIFGGFAVAWIYLELVCVLILHYRSHLPLDLLLGSFAIAALFIYSMCYRLTPADRISPQFLILVFLLGGFAAWMGPTLLGPLWEVITSGIPNGVVSPGQSTPPTPLVYSLPWGTIEELSKILIVLFIARWVPVKNARTGLFIGAAVGFGFSAWENLEYGLSSFLGGLSYLPYTPISTLYSHAVSDLSITTVLREILGPFGHPLWTALVAAALFAGYSNGRFRLTRRLVITFIAVAIVHTAWDFLPALFNQLLHNSRLDVVPAYLTYVIFGVGGALLWNRVRKRANREALRADEPRDTPLAVAPAT